MFWRTLDYLFNTKFWKVTIILLYVFLFISVLQLFLVADESIKLTIASVNRVAPEVRRYIEDSYQNGVLAAAISAFLLLMGLIELIRDFYVAKHYRALANTMIQFANGDVSSRYKIGISGEIGKLGNAFNHMADALQALIEELRDSESRRKEVVVNVAHDLAGPLTAISGYIETLAQNLASKLELKHKNYIDVIRKNIETVNHLISELLDLAKLDLDELPLQKEEFPLKILASDIISRFAKEAEGRDIALVLNEESDVGMILADVHMVERVVSNLVENAIRYTGSKGKIIVSCREQDKYVCLEVRDNGIGIPSEDLPFVFERFYRVDKDRSRKSGGSGLGLAIVKRIVERHGGDVSITSASGQGTCVNMILPRGALN